MLRDYVTHFHPSFLGANDTEEEIIQFVTPVGIFYEKHDGTKAAG